jgi:hypothetical protein
MRYATVDLVGVSAAAQTVPQPTTVSSGKLASVSLRALCISSGLPVISLRPGCTM